MDKTFGWESKGMLSNRFFWKNMLFSTEWMSNRPGELHLVLNICNSYQCFTSIMYYINNVTLVQDWLVFSSPHSHDKQFRAFSLSLPSSFYGPKVYSWLLLLRRKKFFILTTLISLAFSTNEWKEDIVWRDLICGTIAAFPQPK